MNFVPTRSVEEIALEYIDAFWQIYEPLPFLKRTFRHFMMMNGWRGKTNRPFTRTELRLFLSIAWRQGLLRSTRVRFWWQLLMIGLRKPSLLYDYMTTLGVGEHFFSYRYKVREQLLQQLQALKQRTGEDNLQVASKADLLSATT